MSYVPLCLPDADPMTVDYMMQDRTVGLTHNF
jgi:hypothetical protein